MPGPVSNSSPANSATRERILNAAATVMHERGIARATTKEIARQAGFSEALLYKHFSDKQEIYLAVLRERIGVVSSAEDLVGVGDARENLVAITIRLMEFYARSFPMSASIFSDRDLLASWRDGMAAKGMGPSGPVNNLERYIAGEAAAGRLHAQSAHSAAALLCGAAFQQAFLACFDGLDHVPNAEALARQLVAEISPMP
jgi:AcrR family transcriptional regulator